MANERHERARREHIPASALTPVNPFPYVSFPEAAVKAYLEQTGLIYSHRYFKPEWEPLLSAAIDPPYHPEFTLPFDKVVIMVIGQFWGTMPGIIDRMSLAKVVLESKGWRVLTWYENDIRRDLTALFVRDFPNIGRMHRGRAVVNPYGVPNFLDKLRKVLVHQLVRTSRGTRQEHHGRRKRNGHRSRYSRTGYRK